MAESYLLLDKIRYNTYPIFTGETFLAVGESGIKSSSKLKCKIEKLKANETPYKYGLF